MLQPSEGYLSNGGRNGTRGKEWFDDAGNPLDPRSGTPKMSWEGLLDFCVQKPRREKNLEEIRREEMIDLLDMIRSMLAYRSKDRATIQDVVESRWMTRWALPDLKRMYESQGSKDN